MNAPAAIALLLLIIGLFRPIPFLLYLVFILSAFGSLALLPPEMVAGSSLIAISFAAFFLILKCFSSYDTLNGALQSLFNPRQLGFLGMFLVIAVTGAFILPQVFEGSIRAFSMRPAALGYVTLSVANYTQAAYQILSTLTAAAVASAMRKPVVVETLPKAILLGGYFIIGTGLLEMITHTLGISDILSVFYTATYTISGGDILSSHRVLGLMPEPSTYGSMAANYCAMLLFLRPAFPLHLWRRNVPITAWGCGIMAFLSTSSTAYVMMFVILLLYLLYTVHVISPEGRIVKKTIIGKFYGLSMLGFLCLLIVLLDSDLLAYFGNMIDTLIFHKKDSASYVERTSWTVAAIGAFFDSRGLGVGLGSARTSNFFVSILACTGVVGTILFTLFLYVIFTRRAPASEPRQQVILGAAKLSLIPLFAGLALSGTTPDFGILAAILFGVIAGLSRSRKSAQAGFLKPNTPPKPAPDGAIPDY